MEFLRIKWHRFTNFLLNLWTEFIFFLKGNKKRGIVIKSVAEKSDLEKFREARVQKRSQQQNIKPFKSKKADFALNPLSSVPRNFPCLCLSGKKVKNCCGRARYLKPEVAHQLENAISAYENKIGLKRNNWNTKELHVMINN